MIVNQKLIAVKMLLSNNVKNLAEFIKPLLKVIHKITRICNPYTIRPYSVLLFLILKEKYAEYAKMIYVKYN